MDRVFSTCISYTAAALLAGATLLHPPSAHAQSLVPNGDFETFDDERAFPSSWGKHWSYTGEYQPINDIARSHGGFGSLSLSQSGPSASDQWVTVGSARITPQGSRKYALSVWAKGRGQLSAMLYLYGGGRYLEVPATGTITPVDFTPVQSEQWKQYHFDVTIPDSAFEPQSKENAAVDQFEVLFNVKKGPVFLDDVELYLAENKPSPDVKKDRIFKLDRSPLLTFTPMPAPVIDGVVDDAEWASASGTTGFFDQGAAALAERQTTVNAGFDDKHIYLSFRSDQDALLIKEVLPGQDAQFTDTVEGFEVWLQPPGQGYYQLLVMPGGATIRKVEGEQTRSWGDGIQYVSKVVDSGEMHGGILSLGKKTWSGEIAIPFADLGVTAPADGDTWRVNFCRDFSVAEGSARQPADWTTWSPLKGMFSEVKGFGYAQFHRQAAPFKLHALGDLKGGSVGITGDAGPKVQVQASVVMDDYPDKEIVGRELDTAQAGPFTIEDIIRTRALGSARMTLFLGARDTATGQLISQTVAPFAILPSFHIEPQLLYDRGEVEVGISANRLSGLPTDSILELQIAKAEGDEVLNTTTQKLDPANLRFTAYIATADAAPGNYYVKGFVKNAAGDVVASTAEPINIPERPSWYDNTIGITDEIPAPFTPIEVDGNNVGVILREYTLQDSGLPAQVVAHGKEIFTGPAVVRAIVNGKPVEWRFKPLEKLEQKAGEVTWKLDGASDQLELTGTLRMEFDGFGLWDVKFKPRGSVKIEALSIDFPVARENALFAKGDGTVVASLMQDRFTSAPGHEDVVLLGNKVTQWGSWSYSRKGWIWAEKFFNEIYVGSDERGFSFMTETDRNVHGPRYAEFIEQGDATTLMRINLISEPTTLTEELPYVYFFQTTPLKPEPKDPRKWHVTYDPSTIYALNADGYTNAAGQEFLRACDVGMAYYDIMPDGYPRWLHDEKDSQHALKYFQNLGMKITTNLWYSAIADSLPEYKIFGKEWAALPTYGWPTPNSNLTSACQESSYQQFMIWCTEQLVNKLGFDGVYTDATAVPCNNGRHNCGYVGDDGQRHTDLNLLGTRKFVKRMYSVLKEGGKDRVNFSHSGESTSTAAFVDLRTHGEELCWEELAHYRRISPDYFRAKYAQNEYGVVYTVQAIFHYKWRAVGEQVPLSEVLMMCLVHRTQPTLAYNLEMVKVWELFDPFWTAATFIPYWKPEAPATTNDQVNILASTFLKRDEKQALVVVSNWSYENVKATVTLDKDKLGFVPTKVTLVDNATNKETPVDLNNPTFDINSRDYKVLLVK